MLDRRVQLVSSSGHSRHESRHGFGARVGAWLRRRVLTLWDDYDVVLTPTVPQTPRPVGWIFEEEDPWMQLIRAGMVVPFTVGANITGQPAVSVPLHWSESGLPIGSHFTGRPADEATLIRLSAQLEEARPWANKRPPVS
jgi:amidase